jgi:2-oxoglutarate dehydrogenase E1 component
VDERSYTPLNNLSREQARFEVINSPLSEAAVLGFEYGYTLAEPRALVLWEAQFGDFANGAQVIVDQFISSAETKWLRMSGLVMLLPHGFEGQGPEHSSARLERYLQLCAEDNIQVANCTTPASYFHILRRQIHRKFRKPLVLMTPKSLLRHKRCVSRLEDMGPGTSFHRLLLDDAEGTDRLQPREEARRVVLCSGKVYYDLLEAREQLKRRRVYLLRLEQLYPFPKQTLARELARFPNAEIVWCQEEPQNMGGWSFVAPRIEAALKKIGHKCQRPRYVGRPESASTATGFLKVHQREQEELVQAALAR